MVSLTLKAAEKFFPELAVKTIMSNIRVGCIEVELPDSGFWMLGDPASADRCRVVVKDKALFENLVNFWDVGLGESYQAGHFEVDDLAALIRIIILNIPYLPGISGSTTSTREVGREIDRNRDLHVKRGNTLEGSRSNIAYHYDLSNDLYALFLDPTMAYSSAVYRGPGETLAQAQVNKFEVLCRKLELKPSDHLLEIGSGWGGFAIHAAGRYGCRVTTITLSKEQQVLAESRIREAGLSGKIEVHFQDYRDISGSFDKIVSIEMFEAVGHEYFGDFFAKCRAVLKPQGLMAMQVITIPDARFEAYKQGCDWIQKHIFPGCLLPSVHEMSLAIRDSGGLMIQHLENFDLHYARTLRDWRKAFLADTGRVRALGFDDRFIRTWEYYLAYCEASFRTRNLGLVQMVLSFPNNTAWRGPNFLED
ncbi:MAG: cyclopropane-fatty-acyl-phospholipid synthase family protein [Fibrobacterota bacterium]|nr:cyclopropane-fatty-acyl-phospholipid synthase family protein [Fibrobacterota bacterium]